MGEKLKVVSSKDLVKFLLGKGFVISRQKGSHALLLRERDKRVTVVPVHNKDVGVGLLRKILNDCGMTADDLKQGL